MNLQVDIDRLEQLRAWLTMSLFAVNTCLECQDELMTERLGLAEHWSEQVVEELQRIGRV